MLFCLMKFSIVYSNAFDQKLAVAMLRIAEGLDCCEVATANGDDEHGVLAQSSYDLTGNTLMHVDSNLSMSSQIPRVQSVPTMGIYNNILCLFIICIIYCFLAFFKKNGLK